MAQPWISLDPLMRFYLARFVVSPSDFLRAAFRG